MSLEAAIAQATSASLHDALLEPEFLNALVSAVTRAAPRAEDDGTFTVASLAEYLNVSYDTAYNLVSCDPPPFPVRRVGGQCGGKGCKIVIPKYPVRVWLEAGDVPANANDAHRMLLLEGRSLGRQAA
jgi:hypothetical protein